MRTKKPVKNSFEKIRNPLGIMQGRLLPPIAGQIQAFPAEKWEEEFTIARELGLDSIEFIFDGKNYLQHPLMIGDGIKTIRHLESRTGVKVFSVCADYFMAFSLHKGSKARMDESIMVLQRLIKRCSMLDVTEIIVPCLDQSGFRSQEELAKFELAIKKCLPLAEKYHINIALETDLRPKIFSALLRNLGSARIKVNYDIGNSAALGYDLEEEISVYGRWIKVVHIKDRVYKGNTVPLGQGNANFQAVFDKLREIGFSGIFILQAARKEDGKEKETIKEYMEFIMEYIY